MVTAAPIPVNPRCASDVECENGERLVACLPESCSVFTVSKTGCLWVHAAAFREMNGDRQGAADISLIKPAGNDARFDPVSIMLTTLSCKAAIPIVSWSRAMP